MKFKCSGCGCCCKRIDKAVKDIDNTVFKFPYKWDETGRCEMLLDDNTCMVYEDRPIICNVEKLAELFDMDKKTFYEHNNRACNIMMDEDNVDLSFRV